MKKLRKFQAILLVSAFSLLFLGVTYPRAVEVDDPEPIAVTDESPAPATPEAIDERPTLEALRDGPIMKPSKAALISAGHTPDEETTTVVHLDEIIVYDSNFVDSAPSPSVESATGADAELTTNTELAADADAGSDASSVMSTLITEDNVRMLAKLVYGEARGVKSVTEQAGVIWVVLNRLDHPSYGDTISDIVTQPYQFHYVAGNPTIDDYGRDLEALAHDVLERYERERAGEANVGRTLPANYLWFKSDHSGHNIFSCDFHYYSYIGYVCTSSPYDS